MMDIVQVIGWGLVLIGLLIFCAGIAAGLFIARLVSRR